MPFDSRDISRLRNVTTRSISPENVDGVKGGGGRAIEAREPTPPATSDSAGRCPRR